MTHKARVKFNVSEENSMINLVKQGCSDECGENLI